MLHSEEGGERDQGGDRWRILLQALSSFCLLFIRYCLTAVWFRAWEAWVCGRAKEPPGFVTRVTSQNRIILLNFSGHRIISVYFSGQLTTEALWCSVLMAWPSGPTLTTSSSLKISGPCEQHFPVVLCPQLIASV